MSCFFPSISTLRDTLSQEVESSSPQTTSSHRSHESKSFSQCDETGVDIVVRTSVLKRKGSRLGKPRRERRQNCRRVKSRRDWSGELEESEYRLPFPISLEEIERGGRSKPKRLALLPDEVKRRFPPTLDISFVGSMIDIEFPVNDEEEIEETEVDIEGSGLESLETDGNVTDSEWTAFAKELEGIEIFF